MRTRFVVGLILLFGSLNVAQAMGAFDGATTARRSSVFVAHRTEAEPPTLRQPPNVLVPASEAPATTSPALPSSSVAPTAPAAPPTTSAQAAPTSAPEAPPAATVVQVTAPSLLVFTNAGDRTAELRLPAVTEFGNPRVLLATGQQGDWFRVLLPTRPNGSTGWVRAGDVSVQRIDDYVEVDLGRRTLTWARAGQVMLQTTIGIGAPATPTPTGDFFVTDVLPYPPGSDYGSWVIALNGHSDAFSEFEGGDPRIAIHGTVDPSSIGAAKSAGCVRVRADDLARLAGALRPGTPIVIE